LPGRVREAYPGEEGQRIRTCRQHQRRDHQLPAAKVISSLLLAIGSGIVLAAFGVKSSSSGCC